MSRSRKIRISTVIAATAALAASLAPMRHLRPAYAASAPQKSSGWLAYNGTQTGTHYSPLSQINRQNVAQLKVAWAFDTHEEGGLQTNPLIVGRTLFAYTPTQKIVALDATTGKAIWTFDPGTPGQQPTRGFSYWTDGKSSILFAGALTYLYALDPATGKLIPSFGDGGKLDIRKGLTQGDYSKEFAALTTPGVIYKGMIIVGFRAPEAEPALHGDIRAFDVHTGALRWSFHTIPLPGEYGYDTWPKDAWKVTGSANNWTGMSLDQTRGIIYVPTGSAVSDFYGYDRIGDDLFANTLLALDANTGKRLWHFQGVHHDIWDRDFPSPPALLTIHRDGKAIDVVAQPTKQGFLYLFDRVTGKPIFPIEERPFPASDVPGEKTAPTQPVPLAPEPYARQSLTADMLTTRTPEAHAWAEKEFATFRSGGQFIPLSVDKQTVVFPGFDGGAEWGGPAVDPHTGVIYINANDIPWTGGLTENKRGGAGQTIYQNQCGVCHGADRKGSPPAFPSLIDIDKRMTKEAITQLIHGGKGRMPSFPNLTDMRLDALLDFLKTGQDLSAPSREGTSSASTQAAKAGNPNEVAGAALYQKNCAICHGENLQGEPSNFPGLIGIRSRLYDGQILDLIHNGKGRMPPLKKLSDSDTAAILRFLGDSAASLADSSGSSSKQEMESTAAPEISAKYNFTGYKKFQDPDGYPAVVPPWGTLNAIDLNTGKYLWKIPLGEYPELAAHGMKNTGSENYGGPIVTAGGIVIIASTIYDKKIRAFDAKSGELLWEATLPYAGNATPATYMIDGKQYIVIATSGARDRKSPQGAAYVAFALP